MIAIPEQSGALALASLLRTLADLFFSSPPLELLVQVSDGCKLAGVFRREWRPHPSRLVEIPSLEQVRRRNHRGSHGAIFISALGPR